MSKRFPHRMEAVEGYNDVFVTLKYCSKHVSPIVLTHDYLLQVHEIGVLDCLKNRTTCSTILILTLVPPHTYIRGHSLLDPVFANQSEQLIPYCTPKFLL